MMVVLRDSMMAMKALIVSNEIFDRSILLEMKRDLVIGLKFSLQQQYFFRNETVKQNWKHKG